MPTPFGYAFIPAVRQYSAGVVAADGYRLTRVQFSSPVPLEEGLRRAAELIAAAGRPPGALCACELRTPAPYTEAEFASFNDRYVAALRRLGVVVDEGRNPVARTNVCPAAGLVRGPSLHAFCFAEPSVTPVADFVVSGSAEVREGLGGYRDHIVAIGDVTASGLLDKARFVLAEMARRMASFGLGDVVPQVVQVYSVHDVQAVLAGPVASRFAPYRGLTWFPARPPVIDLEYEMDCRTVSVERLVITREAATAPPHASTRQHV